MDRAVLALNTAARDRPRDGDVTLAADADCSVLITADAETAEDLAERIHQASRRHAAPFVVAYGSRDGELVSAAARASNGTLFIGGVDRLSPAAQEELALILGKAHSSAAPRIIAGDTGTLFASVVAGTFDMRLFYRLNTIRVQPAIEEASLNPVQRPLLEVPESLRTVPVESESLPADASIFFLTPATPYAPASEVSQYRRSRLRHDRLRSYFGALRAAFRRATRRGVRATVAEASAR